MGSELQALRAFAKLAATFLLPESGCSSAQGCSPLLGLLAAEILCLWGQLGQRVPWHSSHCLGKGVAEGRRKGCSAAPLLLLEDGLHTSRALGRALLLCCQHLAGEQLPLRMGSGLRQGNSCTERGSGKSGERKSVHFSPLGGKVLRAMWASAIREGEVPFLHLPAWLSEVTSGPESGNESCSFFFLLRSPQRGCQ